MKPSSVVAVAALSCLLLFLALLGFGAALGGSSGACAQVVPSVEPSRAGPGEAFVLRGGGFGGGCGDSNIMPEWPDPPQQDILIEMRQEGKAWDLATVDAGGRPDYAVEAKLKVPKDTEPGGAVVVVHRTNGLQPLEVPFEVLDGEPG